MSKHCGPYRRRAVVRVAAVIAAAALAAGPTCASAYVISTAVGGGSNYSASAPATSASLANPSGVAVSPVSGALVVADTFNNRVFYVNATTQRIVLLAGTGVGAFAGDNGLAVNAQLQVPTAAAFSPAGNLYIADFSNSVMRVVTTATGIITTFAGTPGVAGNSGDGAAATLAQLNGPNSVAFDALGNLLISDLNNHRVRIVAPTGSHAIAAYAGTGANGYSGDGGPASLALLAGPSGTATDSAGYIYIADSVRANTGRAPRGHVRAATQTNVCTLRPTVPPCACKETTSSEWSTRARK